MDGEVPAVGGKAAMALELASEGADQQHLTAGGPYMC